MVFKSYDYSKVNLNRDSKDYDYFEGLDGQNGPDASHEDAHVH